VAPRSQEKKFAVFCLDVSGSMSSTLEVPVGLKLSNMNRATERREGEDWTFNDHL
jgi:hypothetical protein